MPMLITRVDSSKPPMKLQGLRGVNPSIYLGLTIANVASFHAIKFHSLLPRALSSPIIFLFYCYIRGTRGAAVFSETSNRPEKHRGGGVSFAWEMEGRKEGKGWSKGDQSDFSERKLEFFFFFFATQVLQDSWVRDLFEFDWGGLPLDRKSGEGKSFPRTKRNHENDFVSINSISKFSFTIL